MKLTRLRTENREKPMGIDIKNPVFSWNVETSRQNWKQESYRILVKDKDRIVWDSEVVKSDRMTQISYEGEELQSDTRYDWEVTCTQEDKVNSKSWFETGLLKEEDWQGKFIGETENYVSHIFRKTFLLEKKVARARMYVCGLGHHECYLNGEKISDRVLEPGWTDYNKTCFYSVYDVTEFLKEDQNAIGIRLGDGMYNVPGGKYVYYERSYGKMKVNVQMNLTYEDGSQGSLVTDESWHMSASGITFCCIYGGEDYDRRLDWPEFSNADFVEKDNWEGVMVVEPPMGKLVSSLLAPLKVKERYKPIRVYKNSTHSWLYDFGTNFSGWIYMKIRANGAVPGTKISITPAELLDQKGLPDQRVTGRGYQWNYIMGEEEEQEYTPHFTYTGFRYVQVEGGRPQTVGEEEMIPIIEVMEGQFIYPNVEETGTFSCSNPLFEKIHNLIRQAILSNMKSYLTDCPHREKLPWLEQTHLIAPGVMYNFDVENLYGKLEQDMTDAQHDNGLVPDTCPEYVKFGYHEGFVDSPEWGSACIINPWYLYQRYGNITVMSRYYETMKKYLSYLTQKTHHKVLHHGLGDWLDIGPNTPWSQNTPVPVIATCIYYYDICIMKQIAQLLNKTDDVRKFEILRQEVYFEYNKQFFDEQTSRYATGSQAAQAMSLAVGLVPENDKEKVVKNLQQDIVKRNYAITAGDVGHPFLITAALEFGLSDLINEMTNQRDTPGYGYQVANGATTLTEEWDGPNAANPHGSQNHFMLGGIEEWFYSGIGGIHMIHGNRKFDEVTICPYIPEDLDSCSVTLRHPYGILAVSWEKSEGSATVSVKIPPNVTAYLEDVEHNIYKKVGSGIWEYKINCKSSNFAQMRGVK